MSGLRRSPGAPGGAAATRRSFIAGAAAVPLGVLFLASPADAAQRLLVPWPVLRKGSTQPTVMPVAAVKSLQYLLRARGFTVSVTGTFGTATDSAVRAFQRSRGLVVDGIVGPKTWSKLVIQVQSGSRGDAVRGVQVQFQARDLSGIPGHGLAVDGVFGPKTRAAVRGFQSACGLAVDGIVGPLTWEDLVGGALAG